MSPFENLPVECFESIVSFLSVQDIGSLRLTCRSIENKASSHHAFATPFSNKNIKLTHEALEKFALVTSQGHLGCLLQHCTLSGIASDEEDMAISDHSQLLLAQCFRNLKARSPRGGLASLTLTMLFHVSSESRCVAPSEQAAQWVWRKVWAAAASSFCCVMLALEEAQMSVGQSLDIFASVAGCSLACDVFLANSGLFTSTQVFGSLKKLALSLSGPPRTTTSSSPVLMGSTRYGTSEGKEAQSQQSAKVLRHIIRLVSAAASELQDLELHWYDLGRYVCTATIDGNAELGDLDDMQGPMNLKSCKLRGFFTSETDLLEFLRVASPETLALINVELLHGRYAPILGHLNSQDTAARSYHLDDLREGGSMVHFNVPGRSKFSYIGGEAGPSTLTRKEGDMMGSISYRPPPGRPKGSGQLNRWRREKEREYGPPKYDGDGKEFELSE